MASFDVSDVTAALTHVTNGAPPQSVQNQQQLEFLQQSGWVPRNAYNYGAKEPTVNMSTVKQDLAHQQDPVEGSATKSTGWAHDAAKYEWSDSYGDVGPKVEALEKELFRGEFINRAGGKFANLTSVQVTIESETRVNPVTNFKDAGLHPVLLENIESCGYDHTTPIQAYTIPAVLQKYDMIGIAQTGSGKTAAFLIPCISQLMGKAKKVAAPRPNIAAPTFDLMRDGVRAEPLILIVAPTRELCCQIFDEARRLCYRSMLRPCVAYGGAPVRDQVMQLRRGCDILVASPGRLVDFMSRPDVLSLARTRVTILDEADEMLREDWKDEVSKIMEGGDLNTDGDHRYLLFSATFPKRVQKLAAKYLASDHIHVSVGRTGSVHMNVKQNIVACHPGQKMQALYDLLISMPPSRTLIFVRSKKTADFVDDFLFNRGLPSTSIHGDRLQHEREDALRSFKAGQNPILVATGVSARGLDIRNVMHVVNFDLPLVEHQGRSEYVHRIGRTARIGNEGLATSFYTEKDEPMAPFLTKILMETKQPIPDFLQQYRPEDGELNFDEEEEPDTEEYVPAAEEGDTWGGGNGATSGGDAWGSGDDAAVPGAVNWTGDAGTSGAAW